MPETITRPAVPEDIPEILEMIHLLADYEREPDAVKATENGLCEHLFGQTPAVFATVIPSSVTGRRLDGMALWFLNFSTWEGTHGIYLEDLYVREDRRGRGLGRLLISALAQICVERDYPRLEWSVLKWNEPSIAVYRKLGARPQEEWDTYRLTGSSLQALGRA